MGKRKEKKHTVTCCYFCPAEDSAPPDKGTGLRAVFVTRAGPDPRPWMVGGEGGLQGDALDRGAPARLTPCPAGGAPQEGEGQPQQHGFWLESPGLLERRGQAIPSQRGASPDLVGPSTVGRGCLTCLRSPVVPSWCRESGAWAPSSGPFIPPSWALWAPLLEEGAKGPPGGQEGAEGGGSSWGNPQRHPGGGSRMRCVYCLGPAADANTRRQ